MIKDDLTNLIRDYLTRYPADVHASNTLEFLSLNPLFWQRENQLGHITASAWVVNESRDKVLLTHHANHNIWCQLGGHIEEVDSDIFDASLRELKEESGMQNFTLLHPSIFDIDVHRIPENKKGIPAHYHYDIRILFQGIESESIQFDSQESLDVQWIPLSMIKELTMEESVLRMVRKSLSIT